MMIRTAECEEEPALTRDCYACSAAPQAKDPVCCCAQHCSRCARDTDEKHWRTTCRRRSRSADSSARPRSAGPNPPWRCPCCALPKGIAAGSVSSEAPAAGSAAGS